MSKYCVNFVPWSPRQKVVDVSDCTTAQEVMEKANLNWFVDSGWGYRFDRLAAEFERIEKYSALGHLANAEEVIEYQRWKESLLNG